jgi:hypothetical protein
MAEMPPIVVLLEVDQDVKGAIAVEVRKQLDERDRSLIAALNAKGGSPSPHRFRRHDLIWLDALGHADHSETP